MRLQLERCVLCVVAAAAVYVAYLGLRQLDPRVVSHVLCVFGGSIISLMILALCAVGRRV